MFDGVRPVDGRRVQTGIVQRPSQEATGWPDERKTLAVLLVSGLLADDHHRRVQRAFLRYLMENATGPRLPAGVSARSRRFFLSRAISPS